MALIDPVQRLGSHRKRLESWAAPFGGEVREAFAALPPDTWWIPPVQELSRFRLEPRRSLRLLRSWLDRSRRERRPIVWSLENNAGHGLDGFEAGAVLGSFASVERVWQVPDGDASSRILAIGHLRARAVGYALDVALDDDAGLVEERVEALHAHGAPLVLAARSRGAGARGARAVARVLSRAAAAGRCTLALWSDAREPEELARQVAGLRDRGLDGFTLLRIPAGFPWSGEILAGLLGMGFRAGLSSACDGTAADEAEIPGAYQREGAYVASPFDRRVPAGVLPAPPWVEIVAARLGGRRIDDPLGERLARLAPLLDFKRMEGYLREMPGSVDLQQRYHEYRVYNWPPPRPPLTLDLRLCGRLCDEDAVDVVAAHHRRNAGSSLAGPFAIHALAAREATDRLRALSALLREQREGHAYLEQVAESPLRADVREFAAFLPASLGRVLELGCGYGQLARELLPRSTTYALLDLETAVLRHGPSPLRAAADIHALPFRDGAFDSVVANNVLEHAYDPVRALAEIARTLAHRGALYAFIPMDALNADHAVATHLWKADRRGVRLALEAAGLSLCRDALVDLYALGVAGAFPQCHGLVLAVEARRRAG